MTRHNEENERLKHRYLAWQRDAGGLAEASLDVAAYALHLFEESTGYASFRTFGKAQALHFKVVLESRSHPHTGRPLNLVTIYGYLGVAVTFFKWLASQRGFRRLITQDSIQYLRLTQKQARAATSTVAKPAATPAQARAIVEAMPGESVCDRRDRAVICLMVLTGVRDGALITLRRKHLLVSGRRLLQDAREVATKRSKSMDTHFFPMGEFYEQHLLDWVEELERLGFGPEDPLFPATQLEQDKAQRLFAGGLSKVGWATSGPVRASFRKASQRIGLQGLTPHSLRRTLMIEAYDRNLAGEELKAWSQNLGHDHLATSLNSYGRLSADRQASIIRRMWNTAHAEGSTERGPPPGWDDPDLVTAIAAAISEHVRRKREEES